MAAKLKRQEAQPEPSKGREVVVQEAELNLIINQLNLIGSGLQTVAVLVNGIVGRLKERG